MSPSSSDVTREGLRGVAPDREARVGLAAGPGVRREDSYYGLPVLNPPTWSALDIAGYFFAGGLAGASSALAAGCSVMGRSPGLVRRLQWGAAGAIAVGAVGLVHDLGRPGRFYNMLRVLKPTSPMSVGSWILAGYGPCAVGAAVAPRAWPRVRGGLGLAAGALGPAVATYTAVLVTDTAVPAWHEGFREMPFLFAGSAASAAGGLGLVVSAGAGDAPPARRLGTGGAVVELVAGRVMRRRMGSVGSAYESGPAGRLMRAAEGLTAAGAVLAAVARPGGAGSSRGWAVAGGACLMAGSALTRFAVFQAGVQSASDPRAVIDPQRARITPNWVLPP